MMEKKKRLSAQDGAWRKGREARLAGHSRTSNPYVYARTWRGSVTFARGFWRAWLRGYDSLDGYN